ncbi:MAG: NADH:flavin oxidoreductase/NADH oxidase [Bacteroidota bacterium]|nr:NADH:flavin oxidoreductase/NADH oxidase [Bacteroidota bacterium]
MPLLFEPLTLRGITLKNRIGTSPMCQYSSVDGFANDWHLVHLGSRAVGGSGLVICEATAVSPEGRITADDLGIWKDSHIDFLSRITRFMEDHGTVPGIQLAHAGRKASHQSPWKGGQPLVPTAPGGWQTLAPSAAGFHPGDPTPAQMSLADIQKVVEDFRAGAVRAVKAGFKVFEIHGAHGYLLHEFLSPLSNSRDDSYGGTFENRVRILREIVAAVRESIGEDLPLFVRISATDWVEGGWDLSDSVALVKILVSEGVDLVDCSSAGNDPRQQIAVGPLFQVPFAEAIRKQTGMPTAAVGLIQTAREAEEILASGKADLVLMARQMLRDPYFPMHAAFELGASTHWPVQYERAKLKHR